MSDYFERQKIEAEKRRTDYKIWSLEQEVQSLANTRRSSEESEGWGYEDILEVVREQVQPLEERINKLEGMLKELLKAHTPSLVEVSG
jgi:prefoldin subunit 5